MPIVMVDDECIVVSDCSEVASILAELPAAEFRLWHLIIRTEV